MLSIDVGRSNMRNITKSKHNIVKDDVICYNIQKALDLCGIGGKRSMIYSYNKLWKLLIDKHMTKTEMRKMAGISTNILAKMGKGEPVAMDTLAKITTTLHCGLDDIVEIQEGGK